MTSIFRAIGLAAAITFVCWPALTSPANMTRHYEQHCRQKLYMRKAQSADEAAGRCDQPKGTTK